MSNYEKHSGASVTSKIQRLNNMHESLSQWERNFIASVDQGYKKYGSLTDGQFNMLQKLNDRYNAENIQKREEWRKNFTPDMRERMNIMAHYYTSNPPYFRDMAMLVLEDPDFIPTERAYRAMCENKYAQKVIKTSRDPVRFPIGSMAMLREGNGVRRAVPSQCVKFIGHPVVILDHPGHVTNAASGARPVLILPVGDTEPITVEERYLKKLPKRLY